MPGLNTSIQITDRLSPAFRTMTQSINVCLGAFADMQTATGQAVNTAAIRAAQAAMNDLNMEASRIDDELREAATAQHQFNDSVRTGHTAAEGLLGKVKAVVGAYVGMRAVSGVAGLSDEMAQTAARLNLMNDGLQTTAELQEKIYRSAQNSRAAYMDTAAAVSRMGMLAKDAFSGNDELIQFTELMNKNFKVGGAGAQEQAAAMYQLTQAMASGRLQGDEYRSIIENAPLLASAIEDYMVNVQHAQGSMKDWASEGLLTAGVIKAAMFNAADEINAKFEEIPMTWSDVANSVKNAGVMAFQPILQQINQIANNANTQTVVQGIVGGMETIAAAVGPVLNFMVDGAGWVVENWSMIEPLVWGVAGAVGAYAIAQGIANVQAAIANGQGAAYVTLQLAKAAGLAVVALMTGNATLMQTAYNTAVAAFPGIFILTIIGLVVSALVKWVQSVGGVKIAWAIMVDYVKYGIALLIADISMANTRIANFCGKIALSFKAMGINMANAVGESKVNILTYLQDLINNSISMINGFIDILNKIPGVSIEAISWTATFATDAAMAEADKKSARESSFKVAEAAYANEKANRERKSQQLLEKANYEHANRRREIEQMRKEATENKSEKANETALNYAALTEANTGKIADSTEISSEDLKYLRDIAERDIIDRTVFRDIKVDLGGVINQVNEMSDLDGIAEYIGESVRREMLISAEGVH